jgi:hypothetical protein
MCLEPERALHFHLLLGCRRRRRMGLGFGGMGCRRRRMGLGFGAGLDAVPSVDVPDLYTEPAPLALSVHQEPLLLL